MDWRQVGPSHGGHVRSALNSAWFIFLISRYVTAASTIISGVGYIFAKDTFKLVKQSRKKRKENDKKT